MLDKIVFSFLLLCFTSCNENKSPSKDSLKKKTILSGVLYNHANKIYFYQSDWWYLDRTCIDSTAKLSDSSFLMSLTLNRSGLFYITSDNNFYVNDIYLSPNDSIHIYATSDTTITTGRGAEKINYLKEFNEQYRQNSGMDLNHSISLGLDLKEFEHYIDSIKIKREQELDSFRMVNKNVSKDFLNYMKSKIDYDYARKKMDYLSFHNNYADKGNKYLFVDTSYYDFLKNIPLQNDEVVTTTFEYSYFLEYFFIDAVQRAYYKDSTLFKNDDTGANYKYNLAKKLLTNKSRDLAITQILKSSTDIASTKKHFEQLDSLLNDFKKIASNKKYTDYIEKEYASNSQIRPGNSAPNFTLKDASGNNVSLSNFKGKVVYITFWGTWCGSCINSLPKYLALQKKFKSQKDIVFLYVSLESSQENINKWKTFIKEKSFTGVHLVADKQFRNEELAAYKLNFAPTYVLIDKEGKIVSPRANGPEKILEELNAILNN
jgi:peroxiredoxin